MTNEIDIYLQKDGFYVGRMLKSGKLAANARRITEEEIMKMFSVFFDAYCEENKTDTIMIEGEDGTKFFAKKLPTELK